MKKQIVLERISELPRVPNAFNVLSVPEGYVAVRLSRDTPQLRAPKNSFCWTIQADIAEWVRTPKSLRKMNSPYVYAVPTRWYEAHKN